MDDATRDALRRSQTIGLTTRGRRSGLPRRTELDLHVLGDVLFVTSWPIPGRGRDWLHNIAADPRVTVHLRGGPRDVPATARIVTDPGERRPLLEAAARRWGRADLPAMLEHSPLVVLAVDDAAT